MQNLGLHGTVGTGKSTVLNDLLMQLRKRGDRVIIYDKGNNFIPLFYRQDKDKILNPFDARCAPWDLWAECQSVADFDNFATTLLPDSDGGSDPFWVLSARALFVATARRVAKDKDRNIASLLKKLMSISMVDLRAYLQGTDAANLVEGSIEKTAMTIRTILTTYVRSLRYLQGLDEQGHRPFNIRDWLARINTLRQRRKNVLRGKRRKRLALLSLDERRYVMSSWLIRTLPNHELFNMDSDSFDRLVWQNLNLLGLGYDPASTAPAH